MNSWRVRNPGWDVRLLNQETLSEYVDVSEFAARDDMLLQIVTDIARIKLLLLHGGVWADATLFCSTPLDEWLPSYMDDHFFAFASERKDRWMTNWFLAGTEHSETLDLWLGGLLRYWRGQRFRDARSGWPKRVIRKCMSLRKRGFINNDFWFSKLILKRLRLHPYPINMYLFEKSLQAQVALSERWFARETLYDIPAESIQMKFGMNAPLTQASRAYIDDNLTPVHKLNWRQDQGEAPVGSNFEYLLEGLA